MINKINEVVGEKGYEVVEVKGFKHKDDSYLKVLVAKNQKEYVCWLYNDSCKGLFEGYYTNSYQSAHDKMMEKIS